MEDLTIEDSSKGSLVKGTSIEDPRDGTAIEDPDIGRGMEDIRMPATGIEDLSLHLGVDDTAMKVPEM